MQIKKVIQRRIRRASEGVDFAGDVNAVNVSPPANPLPSSQLPGG